MVRYQTSLQLCCLRKLGGASLTLSSAEAQRTKKAESRRSPQAALMSQKRTKPTSNEEPQMPFSWCEQRSCCFQHIPNNGGSHSDPSRTVTGYRPPPNPLRSLRVEQPSTASQNGPEQTQQANVTACQCRCFWRLQVEQPFKGDLGGTPSPVTNRTENAKDMTAGYTVAIDPSRLQEHQIPSNALAPASASTEAWWLPASCSVSPVARSSLT